MGVKLELSPYGRTQTVFLKNKVLKRIYGHKRKEVTKILRKAYNEELHSVFSSPNNI
jgi:hypothetical protein